MMKIKMESQKMREEKQALFFFLWTLLFFGLLKGFWACWGALSLTRETGRKGWTRPQNPEKAVGGGAELAAASAPWFYAGAQLPFLEGWLRHRWCCKLCNPNARKSWENPTKWYWICLWSSRDSKFGQWNSVRKWEMHQGYIGNLRFIRTASGHFQRSRQMVVIFLRRRDGGGTHSALPMWSTC